MAKQTGFNKRAKFKIWIYKHRVMTGFLSLIAALVVYLVCSWLVLQVQIHFERERFNQVSKDISYLNTKIKSNDKELFSAIKNNDCSYISNPNEFRLGIRICDINDYLLFSAPFNSASSIISEVNNFINQSNSLKYSEVAHRNLNDLTSYDYTDKEIDCSVDFWSFSNHVLPYQIKDIKNWPENGFLVQINCSKSAKAEYFPAT